MNTSEESSVFSLKCITLPMCKMGNIQDEGELYRLSSLAVGCVLICNVGSTTTVQRLPTESPLGTMPRPKAQAITSNAV